MHGSSDSDQRVSVSSGAASRVKESGGDVLSESGVVGLIGNCPEWKADPHLWRLSGD